MEQSRTLGIPLDPQRQGKAWFVLAEAYHAEGQETLAQHAYGECINFRSPYAYRARCCQAAALAEAGKIDEARGILEQNLHLLHEEDNADREAQEKTLYGLARLLYDSRDYSTAATHYKQALERFSDNPDATRARFELAECYRELASQEVKASDPANRLTPQASKHHESESRRYLRLAIEKYQEVSDDLCKRGDSKLLSPQDDWLLWQAQLLHAGCRHSFGEYGEAQKLYQQLATRYQGKAQELYALHGVAGCYWARNGAGDGAKARQVVDEIRAKLAKLGDPDLKIGPESWDRKKWEGWLQQVTKTTGKP
jgi:tetratricopeptide (TPR) repeat protein